MNTLTAAVLAVAVTYVLYLFWGAMTRARAHYAQILASRREAGGAPEEPNARERRHKTERALHADALRTRLILEAYVRRGGVLTSEEGKRVLREHTAAHERFIVFRGYAPERDAYLLALALCELSRERPLPESPYGSATDAE